MSRGVKESKLYKVIFFFLLLQQLISSNKRRQTTLFKCATYVRHRVGKLR